MINIFVEGTNSKKSQDHSLIKFMIDSKIPELVINQNYKIINVGGWTNLSKVDNLFKENTDSGGLNLVIFDADSEDNDGGFEVRREELLAKKAELNIEFELFLFPNNNQNGDLELLLEKILHENHEVLLTCFEEYENCISNPKDEDGNSIYKAPIRKSKIYSCIDAIPKSKKQREEFHKGNWFFGNNEIWNFENPYLNPLFEFLDEHLKC